MMENNSLLKDFWQRTLGKNDMPHGDWNEQVKAIYQSGKGLEETLRYLYSEKPSLEDFILWIDAGKNDGNVETLNEDVFTPGDISFFKENGYAVLHNAVTDEQCNAATQAISEYLSADINDPATWYKPHEEMRGLMLMFYHHPALNVNRNSRRIHKAYEQLYGSPAIHKVVDKVSFNPPETSFYKFKGSPLHWDVSLALPIPFKLQGLLYLNDVESDGGPFYCVPGFHNKIEEWLNGLPENVNPREEALRQLKPEAITGKAGDLIIWHQALPHCASPNYSTTPRFVQYITYDPDDLVKQEVWK